MGIADRHEFVSLHNELPVGFAAGAGRFQRAGAAAASVPRSSPEVSEQASPEQTAFKVGQRAFVVVETYRTPEGKPYNCLAFKASFFDLERLRQERGFFPAPYLGGPGWLGRRLDNEADPIDWIDLQASLRRSHRQIVGRAVRKAGAGIQAA